MSRRRRAGRKDSEEEIFKGRGFKLTKGYWVCRGFSGGGVDDYVLLKGGKKVDGEYIAIIKNPRA